MDARGAATAAAVTRARSFAPVLSVAYVTPMSRYLASEVERRVRTLAAELGRAIDACDVTRAADAARFCDATRTPWGAPPSAVDAAAIAASIERAVSSYWIRRTVALEALACAVDAVLCTTQASKKGAAARLDDAYDTDEAAERAVCLECLEFSETLKDAVRRAWTPMLSGLEAASVLGRRRCPALLNAYDCTNAVRALVGMGPAFGPAFGPASALRTSVDSNVDAWVLLLFNAVDALALADGGAPLELFSSVTPSVSCAACLIHPRWFEYVDAALPPLIALKHAGGADSSAAAPSAQFTHALQLARDAAIIKRLRAQFKKEVACLRKAGAAPHVVGEAKLALAARYAAARATRRTLAWGWTVLRVRLDPRRTDLHRERVGLFWNKQVQGSIPVSIPVVRRHLPGAPLCLLAEARSCAAAERVARRGELLDLSRLAAACTRSVEAAAELERAVTEDGDAPPGSCAPSRPAIFQALGIRWGLVS